MPDAKNGRYDCILTTSIINSDGMSVAENFVPLSSPLHMKLEKPTITFSVDDQGTVTIQTDKFAAFVTLTTRAQGRFSDNAFLLSPGTKQVKFIWFGKPDVPTLKSTLRLEHAQEYIVPPIPNLASGKPCKASSVDDPGRTCMYAFDDDFATRWSSNYGDNNWIDVDLGSNTRISKVVLYWESAYAKRFQIQTSNDGNTWTTQYETNSGNGGVESIPFNAVARYVRMNGEARATQYGYSLFELQIF